MVSMVTYLQDGNAQLIIWRGEAWRRGGSGRLGEIFASQVDKTSRSVRWDNTMVQWRVRSQANLRLKQSEAPDGVGRTARHKAADVCETPKNNTAVHPLGGPLSDRQRRNLMPFQASRYPTYGQAIPTNSCLSVKVFERGRRNKRQCTWSIARFRSGYHRSAWRRVPSHKPHPKAPI
ncbi:predicted protein [Histoplasma capsulatum G186AR]|uniref:Uncharacterized protein n=1 Tax=Ajellomyces capsulatus (strain G186AR / H82 / ATCC MYA-2454 / RMSCC 2432) TaxID=447093 RepID=C0NVN4_AJECG|nr:uncharacterized protein HCBG_07214 [Histoplasma capsulatum G186AR]EEH04574.1 predicted protein [Histoplasma capsulatum G186AR]